MLVALELSVSREAAVASLFHATFHVVHLVHSRSIFDSTIVVIQVSLLRDRSVSKSASIVIIALVVLLHELLLLVHQSLVVPGKLLTHFLVLLLSHRRVIALYWVLIDVRPR